jgi:DNA modification methylase
VTSTVVDQASGDSFTVWNGDCVEVLRALPPASVHLTITSPPYLSLFTYSPSPRDISNSKDDAQFWEHFGLVMDELFRVTKPGRIVVIDCMNVPSLKHRDGHIYVKDFRGDIIRAMSARGFLFHSEHLAWKDPLLEAVRTKALGLMHKQLCSDSSMSRAGLPQYLIAFRKPGQNAEPISHPNGLEYFIGDKPPETGNLSHERWRRYASPVWMDIDFSRTLNATAAREESDTRHLCPMSMDLIDRALQLWSNPGDVVLDPFNGVGSTGYCALKAGRKYIGAELKRSYFEQAVRNLRSAADSHQPSLFDALESEVAE